MDYTLAISQLHFSCAYIPDQCYAYNFTLGVCTKCGEGYELTNNGLSCGVCDEIDPNCSHCDEKGNCIACATGTLLDDFSGCAGAISGCDTYVDET